MSDYPTNGAEILEPQLKFRDETIEAASRFKHTGPWSGTMDERMSKFRHFHTALCQIYSKQTKLHFGLIDGGCSGSSYYRPIDDVIVLRGKLSVVTYLHEFAHAMGRDERGAVRWSICLFKQVFPEEFSRCEFHGHMLKRKAT